MDRLHKEMYDALTGGKELPEDWVFASRLDAAVVAAVARRHLFKRDVCWGVTLAVTTLTGLGMLAWYTPTQTVTVTEIEVRDAPDRACLDALDKAGELFLMFSKVTDTLARRDAAEQRAHDAVYAMDREALTAASNEMFVENDIMGTQIRQASEVDLTTPTQACRG